MQACNYGLPSALCFAHYPPASLSRIEVEDRLFHKNLLRQLVERSFRPVYASRGLADDRGMKCLNSRLPKTERKSHWINETGEWFGRQTSMNEHPTSKRNGVLAIRTHRVARSEVIDLSKQLPEATRGLLICLGWLRLFQRIVTPHCAAAGRKGSRYER